MKRNTEELKKRLVEVGMKEIENNGIDNVSLRTIAKKCHVTHGTPYRHFSSKDHYLKVVSYQLSCFFDQEVFKGLHSSLSARESLVLSGLQFVNFAQEYPRIFEAVVIKCPFNYLDNTDEEASFTLGFNKFKELISRFLEEEKLNYSLSSALVQIFSFISGLAILTTNQKNLLSGTDTIEKTIQQMLDSYIKGGKE
ncbi:MAG: TetR/AcrR family transcriptional regulator [Streptococcus sp.]|nr:TetR/AcrR family transcriptional regulator [Streptococcus sp.]